ncbi:Holliday junction branch migration protein RuvA [Candidatus Wolfebacteria bacterium]|nr:Holliday junction branch migration protein RuvA [Candidatus Wolfebacteria bacterium]
MIYSLSGKLLVKKLNFAVIEAGGIGFKIFISSKSSYKLPKIGSKAKLFCYTNVRQDGLELYGFFDEEELEIFELFIAINSIGPKIALRILSELPLGSVLSAIDKNRPDILSRISGIGKKTAERIILELRGKVKNKSEKNGEKLISIMEMDEDLEKALKNLGYKQSEIKDALRDVPSKIDKIDERLKFALKFLSKSPTLQR